MQHFSMSEPLVSLENVRFAYGERTILRDIDHLSAAGVPLWGERGRQGGFQLRSGWTTQLTGMTEAEANALMLAGMPAVRSARMK